MALHEEDFGGWKSNHYINIANLTPVQFMEISASLLFVILAIV